MQVQSERWRMALLQLSWLVGSVVVLVVLLSLPIVVICLFLFAPSTTVRMDARVRNDSIDVCVYMRSYERRRNEKRIQNQNWSR